jgi:hypothetical protein
MLLQSPCRQLHVAFPGKGKAHQISNWSCNFLVKIGYTLIEMSRYFILTSLRKYNVGEGKIDANENGTVLQAMHE